MVKTICLLIGSFLILQAHGTSVRRAGCNGDPNAEIGCDTCNTNCDNYDIEPKVCSRRACLIDECKCKEGFVKNSKGLCIRYEKCPPVCGINEEYSKCYGHCKKTLKNKNPVCADVCTPGCVCQPGYLRDETTNECIREDQCSSSCKKNEVCSPCSGHCQKTCKNKNPICTAICLPGCICQPNYLRDPVTGECIKEDQCPLVCGKNEVVSLCNGHCQRTCSVSNSLCPRICQRGCVCRSGFVRDDNTGKCIKQTTCPKIKCGVNEVRTNCLPACGEDTCERVGKEKSVCYTFAPVSCRVGCVCRKNLFRNADGVCTSATDCLKCQNPNEIFGCKRTCDDKKCATLNKPCNIVNKRCTEKCYCRKDYARNCLGQCIPISECPKKPKCGKNEVFACHITCPPKACRSMIERIICPVNNPCREQCDCKDNYMRNNDGICIPSNQCFPSLNKPKTDNSAPPTEIDETSEPDNGDALPAANDDFDDEDEYDDQK